MKFTTICLMAGLACIFMLVAGCTTTPGTSQTTTAATTMATQPPTTVATTVAPATSVPNATAANLSWTGTWNTTWLEDSVESSAIMYLKQNGTFVTGTYEIGNDTLQGTVSGTKLAGTWNETNGTKAFSGVFEFVLSADKNSFTGKWAYTAQNLTNSTEFWNGVRV
ncbi:MAG: hypothetical protein LUQ25_08165 [Methanoregulaceae archaeon]|nr:hypothetical protein [Methanoregulaceae archaeon]